VEAIDFLSNWIQWLTILITGGSVMMITYQLGRKALADDEGVISDANTKIRHAVIGAIIGVSLSSLVILLRRYYM
jgi:hypothetical protein